jgi:hypothetical protein
MGVAVMAAREVLHVVNQSFAGVLTLPDPHVSHGRFPYQFSTEGEGFRVFWSPGKDEILIEIEGTGCQKLEQAGRMRDVVELALDRLTRVDIATDIVTDTDPMDFTDQRTNKRHKSHETSVTSTGRTSYVGSRRSDRYARVYRYEPPHPRSDRLRVECVYRGEQAKALARTWLECGNDETAARAGNQYGWSHPDWTPHSEEKIEAWRPDRKTHSRLHWYKTQVKPAIRAMVVAGHLPPSELLADLLGASECQQRAILKLLTDECAESASS